MPITYYHNPRCSKSRAGLTLLQAQGIEPTVVEYLKTPPSRNRLKELCKRLGIQPGELVRRGETTFKEHYAGQEPTTAAGWLAALHTHPILIERPIADDGSRAVIGRPPERVLELT